MSSVSDPFGSGHPAPRAGEPPVRPRVLFIAGTGRSGSTLLERMLGQVPEACPLGEVVHL